ncbi:hypothetical protein JG688_00018515 [Phytophthora aleatoria]|uniref:Uncharacterized protein n=1 Tax=Phytophthora aleatoria TaxID=2496075 RepID=A0A8J5IR70_9STRA|nr:hypothetical protein JG688_00018515 [Phytophthora aleatoria]
MMPGHTGSDQAAPTDATPHYQVHRPHEALLSDSFWTTSAVRSQHDTYAAAFALQGRSDEDSVSFVHLANDTELGSDFVFDSASYRDGIENDSDSTSSKDSDDSSNSVGEMCEELNVTSEEKEIMEYEFDFPDCNLDVGSISQLSDDDFEWLDDSLLDLVCEHHLELEEKDSSDDFSNSETTSGGAPDLQVSSNESSVEEDIYIIPPPPEKAYESHDIAEAAVREWTLQHNYNVSRRRVGYIPVTKKIWARNYECDRAGRPSVLSILQIVKDSVR